MNKSAKANNYNTEQTSDSRKLITKAQVMALGAVMSGKSAPSGHNTVADVLLTAVPRLINCTEDVG
jgi:hypothetical protein